MVTFKLIEPFIKGSIDLTEKANNSEPESRLKVAQELWKRISASIKGNIPKFMFTIMDIDGQKYYAFEVTENIIDKSGEGVASFKVRELGEVPEKIMKKIQKKQEKLSKKQQTEQKGGHHHHKHDEEEDDSSSTTTSEYYLSSERYTDQPIVYFWYSPDLYKNLFKVEQVYIPTFTYTYPPYINLILV